MTTDHESTSAAARSRTGAAAPSGSSWEAACATAHTNARSPSLANGSQSPASPPRVPRLPGQDGKGRRVAGGGPPTPRPVYAIRREERPGAVRIPGAPHGPIEIDGEDTLLVAAVERESDRFRGIDMTIWGIDITRCPDGHLVPSAVPDATSGLAESQPFYVAAVSGSSR